MAPIPEFDHNLVLPPHRGDPRFSADVSPYACTSLELCRRFATSPKRREILEHFLAFRKKIHSSGMTQGYQWLDGSFLEDVETRENRSPEDLDLLTIYWGYSTAFQEQFDLKFPEFSNHNLSKSKYRLDHYPVDIGLSPDLTVDNICYWIQLFSHNRDAVWKGMIRVELDTPEEDDKGLRYLEGLKR